MTSQLFDDIQAINEIHTALRKPLVTEESFKRKRDETDAAFHRRVRNHQIEAYGSLQRQIANGLVDFFN